MAGVSNFSKFRTKQFSHDVFFDGALLSSTRASLVVELIKYFLYERQQIPLPVDELSDQVTHYENLKNDQSSSSSWLKHKMPTPAVCEARRIRGKSESSDMSLSSDHSDIPLTDLTNTSNSGTVYNEAKKSKIPGSNRDTSTSFHDRKTKAFVTDLTKLFNSLQNAFECCPEIEQVAVILGGTVMNPKESYLISFPPPSPEADSIPLLACKRTLFQQIISEDLLGSMSAKITPTNMMVLVSAPRSCPLKGFLPKHTLRSPKTGAIISFNFHCNYVLPVSYDLTIGDGSFEMSGIEPLDIHGKDRPLLAEKNLMTDVCESDQNRSKFGCRSGEDRSDESHIRLELCNLKLSAGGDHFHVATPGVGRGDRSLNIKPQLVSSTPILMSHSTVAHSEISPMPSDYIWYQSPLVIKGYKNKDRSKNHHH